MSVRTVHVSVDTLTAMALVGRGAETPQDVQALRHVSECAKCAAEFSRLSADADALRATAFASTDALFDDGMLETQRARILDRLAMLGQVARVLPFPRPNRSATMPVSTGSRRWVSVAAAAGLIIGLVAGQLLHLMPSDSAARREGTLTVRPASRPVNAGVVAASNAGPSATDDQFLNEIEAAVQLRRAHSLRALDALTPSADFRDLPMRPR